MAEGPYYAKFQIENQTSLAGSTGSSVLNSLGLTDAANYKVTNTDAEVKLVPGSNSVIDVINDFAWTASPTTKTKLKIPYLYATELRQEQNSLISSALYYLNSITNSSITTDSVDLLTKFLGSGAGGSVSGALETFKSGVNSLISSGVDQSILSTYLQSYLGMYLTKPTKFKYAFPFFSGKPYDIKNSWLDSSQIKPRLLGDLIPAGMQDVDAAAATLNIMQPGTYIEKPRYFKYPTEGESISFSLPLINTIQKGNKLPYQQNYELIWILAYQNKPYRTSFSRILPPKLYTVSIPGMKYFPYAYISNMTVDFLGTRRQLEVNTPVGAATTSIPEAYMLNITFTSLLADTGNLMISEGFRSKVYVETVS
jgi:hypothetical protein